MLDFKHMTSTSGADNGLLPRSPSRRARQGFESLHLPGPSAWPFRTSPGPACSARHLQAARTSRKEHCASGWLKGTHTGIAPSLSVARSHPPQCKTGAGNITGPGMYTINISILLCLSPSLPPTLLSFYTALLGPQVWAGLSGLS